MEKIFAHFSKLINHALKLDPQLPPKLSALSGKVIALEFCVVNITCYLSIQADQSISLTVQAPEQVDLRIAGTPFSFLRLLVTQQTPFRPSDFDISIHGNIEMAQTLQEIAQTIDIDWAGHLAKYTGDIAAHRIEQSVKGLFSFGQRAKDKLQQDVTEYLQEEVRYLPTATECDTLFDAIDTIRSDVARIDAKIKRLQLPAEKL